MKLDETYRSIETILRFIVPEKISFIHISDVGNMYSFLVVFPPASIAPSITILFSLLHLYLCQPLVWHISLLSGTFLKLDLVLL